MPEDDSLADLTSQGEWDITEAAPLVQGNENFCVAFNFYQHCVYSASYYSCGLYSFGGAWIKDLKNMSNKYFSKIKDK